MITDARTLDLDVRLSQAWLLLAGVLLVVLVQRLTHSDPLRDIPGPWLAKYTPLLLAYHTRTGKRYLYVDALHKRYGPFVRITPTQVSCSSPSAPGVIYAQGASSLPKSPFYRAFYVSGTPSLFSIQDRAGHAQKRRVLAHPFSYACVKDFEGWMRASLGKFVRGLDRRCVADAGEKGMEPEGLRRGLGVGAETPGRAGGSAHEDQNDKGGFVDVLMWLNYMTFDVISDLAFGEPLGMLDRESDVLTESESSNDPEKLTINTPKTLRDIDNDDEDHGVASMIDHRGRTAAFLGLFPFLLPPAPLAILAWWLPDDFVKRGLKGTEALSHIAQRCVKHRLNSGAAGRRGDLLDRLVDGMRSERGLGDDADEGEVSEEDVVTEAMLLLTAGSDTTANSTAAVLFHILRSPQVLALLRKEIEDALGSELQDDGERDGDEDAIPLIWHDQIKNLKYLQATIDEGLRMFATNAFGLPRVVPEGGEVCVAGRIFGAGTELSAPAYTIQHDPSIWGDPDVFRPERWLESNGTSTELKRHLLTFGMGPRACIGKNLAYMQMQLLIATLVTRYEMKLRDGVLESVEGFMHKPVDLWVRLRRRGAMRKNVVT